MNKAYHYILGLTSHPDASHNLVGVPKEHPSPESVIVTDNTPLLHMSNENIPTFMATQAPNIL